jgi:type II secretory pathway pseudopilin PulG
MLAVLSILSLVMVTVSIRWGDVYKRSRLKATVERVIDFDFKARRHAIQQHRNGTLSYNLDNHRTLKASRWVRGVEKRISMDTDSLNRIESIRTARSKASDEIIELPISNLGATPTYCVEIKQGDEQRWIVFAGRTGQSEVFEKSEDADEVFATLEVVGETGAQWEASRPDAN